MCSRTRTQIRLWRTFPLPPPPHTLKLRNYRWASDTVKRHKSPKCDTRIKSNKTLFRIYFFFVLLICCGCFHFVSLPETHWSLKRLVRLNLGSCHYPISFHSVSPHQQEVQFVLSWWCLPKKKYNVLVTRDSKCLYIRKSVRVCLCVCTLEWLEAN